MVELQIVILAVAGSSPVGHPQPRFRIADFGLRTDCGIPPRHVARPLLKKADMLNPANVIGPDTKSSGSSNFWLRILNDEQLSDCDDLQKLVVGCEIIAALDGVDLLAA